MERAIHDAARRLREPQCQRILDDFTDRSGNRLSTNLNRLGMTPADFVERGLVFVDASSDEACRIDLRAAFTSPGSRLIFTCAARLIPHDSGLGMDAALLVIHEALHALGLGENPPTPAEITRQVARRCGS
jgi:hypothetical protein